MPLVSLPRKRYGCANECETSDDVTTHDDALSKNYVIASAADSLKSFDADHADVVWPAAAAANRWSSSTRNCGFGSSAFWSAGGGGGGNERQRTRCRSSSSGSCSFVAAPKFRIADRFKSPPPPPPTTTTSYSSPFSSSYGCQTCFEDGRVYRPCMLNDDDDRRTYSAPRAKVSAANNDVGTAAAGTQLPTRHRPLNTDSHRLLYSSSSSSSSSDPSPGVGSGIPRPVAAAAECKPLILARDFPASTTRGGEAQIVAYPPDLSSTVNNRRDIQSREPGINLRPLSCAGR